MIESFGTERDDIQGSKFQKYKGKDGRTDLVGLIPFPDGKFFKGAKCHFKDRAFQCKSTSSKKEICCTHSYEQNRPFYRIASVVIVYNFVDKDGKQSLRDYTLLPWIFREAMYNTLKMSDKDFPLAAHDLKLTCSDEKFQKITPLPSKNSIWSSNAKLKEKVLKEAQPIFEDAIRGIGADLGLIEIRELLGVDEPGITDANANISLDDVMGATE
jgi:hypothetical protein